MGKASRDKGARWEREVAKLFDQVLPHDVRRAGFAQSQAADVAADVDTGGVFWVECKVGKAPPTLRALEQAEATAPEGPIPLAVVKRDRGAPFVVVRLEPFLRIVGEWQGVTS